MSAYPDLLTRWAEIHDLQMTGALLDWDQQTYMPPGGVAARAEARATLSKVAHELLTDAATARLLDRAERETAAEVADSAGGAGGAGADNAAGEIAAQLARARRDFDKATRLPGALVAETARVTAHAQEHWAQARADNNYQLFAPWLERIIEIERRTADALGYSDDPYDALLDQYEEGMTRARLDPLLSALKARTRPLVQLVADRADAVSDAVTELDYDEEQQRQFAETVLADCGFDWQRGRQDRSVHPFCTNFSRDDVRITTRYSRNDLSSALFGSLHEMGHGLYEQGIPAGYERTPLAGGVSLGVHESQSRLWENLVGRSRGFWNCYLPRLRRLFPQQLGSVDGEEFYRAINRAAPSLIRVEADEVTYNLHIILRYEMECDLLHGKLTVADAPEAWNAKMQDTLGVRPARDSEGILQDVHWSIGAFGYFPTYTLGNILSVQLWQAARRANPDIPAAMAGGDFAPLLGWLRRNVHCHGRRYTPAQLTLRATGSELDVAPYADYLETKFHEIYGAVPA